MPIELSDAQAWAREDINRWERRRERFEREQDLFYLKEPMRTKQGEEVVVPNDPHFLTEKASRALAMRKPRINVIPADPSKTERAQRIENMARKLRSQWETQHSRGLTAPLAYDEAKYIVQRGWLCTRLTLNTSEDSLEPLLYRVFDPATVYPHEVGGRLVRVTHAYRARASELLADEALAEAEDALSLIDVQTMTTVYSQYVLYKGKYYHMVWGSPGESKDGLWLKKPTEIGYMPWDITLAVGSPWRATEWDNTDYIEHIGESFFTGMVGMYDQEQKTMSMLATILATMANPPTAYFADDGGRVEPSQVSMRPGARMSFPKGRIEQFRPGPGLGEVVTYYQMLEERQKRAGFAAVSFGEQTGIESGYMGDVLRSGNADVLAPYDAALSLHMSKTLSKSMLLLARFWEGSMDVYSQKTTGRPQGMGSVTAADIISEAPTFNVRFSGKSLQERLQIGNLAAGLVRDKMISLPTARNEDYIDLDDPFVEEKMVQADLIKTDPTMIKALIPMALAFTGLSLEQQLFGILHGSEIAQLLMMGMGGGQPQMPPGMGGGQPPGMPGEVAPPIVGGQGGMMPGMQPGAMSPELMQIIQALREMQLAQGGAAGMGGVPPVPGTNPIQLPMGL